MFSFLNVGVWGGVGGPADKPRLLMVLRLDFIPPLVLEDEEPGREEEDEMDNKVEC